MATAKSYIHPSDDSWEIYTLFRKAADGSIQLLQSFAHSPHSLTLTKVRALMYLEQHQSGTGSLGELAEVTASSLGWASRMVEALVAGGFVTCIRDTLDRRVVHVKLTQKGIFTANLLATNLQGPIAAALSEAQPKERAAIGQFLQRFTTALNQSGKNTAHESPLPFASLPEKQLLNGNCRA